MNKQISSNYKRLILFMAMLLLGAIAILAYSAFTGNINQKFTDIVIEFTATDGSNKSAERSLFYIFSAVGAFLYAVVFLKGKWGSDTDILKRDSNSIITNLGEMHVFVVGLLVTFITNLVIYKSVSWVVVYAFTLFALLFLKNRFITDNHKTNTDAVNENGDSVITDLNALTLFFVSIYAMCGIYRGLVFAGANYSTNIKIISSASFVIVVVVLIFLGKNSRNILRSILVAQIFVPLTLLVYLASDYIYNGQTMNIHISVRVKLVIYLLVLCFIAEAIYRIKKSWKSARDLDDVLAFGTVVSIMAFNRFSGSGSIISSDLHHPFENIIGYSQMFELGQKAFSEYIPISGMYSIVHGLFLKIFGLGFAGFYSLSTNMFYLAIIIIIAFFLRRQLKAQWVLLISLVFLVTDYNRVALIVPIILLLTWPKLIQRKNLWLKAWFLTSFVHGLYYPVFGAAVCIGFMPLGIWQIVTYSKSGELNKDVKTIKFWAWWIVCLIPVILGSGWLIGTLKHMLAMGSQTIYADGIARFGQEIADDFLPYISSVTVRLIAYYLFTYLIMISIIWLSVALFLKSGNASMEKIKLKLSNPEPAFIAISIAIMMLISFSYTVVRFDYYDIYSRSDGVIRAAFVVLIVLLARYVYENNRNAVWIFVFTIFIISAVAGEGFLKIDADEKLEASYTVPEGYVYVANNEPRLGECFLAEDSYAYITHINDYLNTLDKDRSYLGIVDSFGLYYLCNAKGDAAMEILNTIKGFGAVEETVDVIRENDTIVGMCISPLRNYYFYHWLVTSGDYIFDNDARLFIPNDGSFSREEILQQNENINLNLSTEAEEIGDVAGSFGSSMDTLMDVFTERDYDYSIIGTVDAGAITQDASEQSESNRDGEDYTVLLDFAEEFDGNDADFMYIEFEDMTDNYGYALYSYHNPVFHNDASKLAKSLMKKIYNDGMTVTVSWQSEAGEEFSMTCNMDEGKLLLPLGAARGWLLNDHDELSIVVKQDDEVIHIPAIKDIKMLKAREVQ